MSEAEFLVDVDITGLGVQDAAQPVTQQPVQTQDNTKEMLDRITRERDEWKSKAEGGATQSQSAIEAERTRAVAADKRAGEATEGELRARWDEANTKHDHLAQGVIQTKDYMAGLKREMANAIADETLTPQQRGQRVAEAQAAMSLAAADLRTLEQGEVAAKEQIEVVKRTVQQWRSAQAEAKTKPEPQAQTQTQRQETAEDWIGRFPSKTQDWLKTHRDFVTNGALNKKLVTFAEDYHDGGARALHDDAFIEALNKRFGFGSQEAQVPKDVVEVDPSANAQGRTAAPVSRSAPTMGSTVVSGSKVRLSQAEVDTATALFPDMDRNEAIKRYGKNKLMAIQEGKYVS